MTQKNINPASISRILTNAGFRRAEWRKFGVRLWNDGFYSDSNPFSGSALISFGLGGNTKWSQESLDSAVATLESMAQVVSAKGYVVSPVKVYSDSLGYDPYFVISSKS